MKFETTVILDGLQEGETVINDYDKGHSGGCWEPPVGPEIDFDVFVDGKKVTDKLIYSERKRIENLCFDHIDEKFKEEKAMGWDF